MFGASFKRQEWVRRFSSCDASAILEAPRVTNAEAIQTATDALAAAGLVGLERQWRIDLPGYGPARFDLAVPAARLAIEVDLHPTHGETAGRRRDAARDDAARRIDWTVERVLQIHFGPELPTTVERILDLARSLVVER